MSLPCGALHCVRLQDRTETSLGGHFQRTEFVLNLLRGLAVLNHRAETTMIRVCRFLFVAALFVIFGASSSVNGAELRQVTQMPTAVTNPVRAACEMAHAIAANTPGVSIRRSMGRFRDEAFPRPVDGCQLRISGSFARAKATGDASARLHEGFLARGWHEVAEYSADGKDGTQFAFYRETVICLFRGEWDGGADGDPEIPGKDWYKVLVLCTSPVPVQEKQR